MNRTAFLTAITLCMTAFAGDELIRDEKLTSSSSVGVTTRLDQIVLPGSELEAKPIADRKTPIVVRVVATFRHGTDFRYDLEYYGLEPGQYDLRDFLQRKDRTSLESVPPLSVRIDSRLPPGQILPSSLEAKKLPNVGGYRIAMGVGIVVWTAIVVWLLLGGRRAAVSSADPERSVSPAERLRPLVADAISGKLTPEGKAELERVLLSYWRGRLGLEDAEPVAALSIVREHPEAGALLRMMEDWLHRPGGAGQVDIAFVLAPYQNLPNDVETGDVGSGPVRSPSILHGRSKNSLATSTPTQGS